MQIAAGGPNYDILVLENGSNGRYYDDYHSLVRDESAVVWQMIDDSNMENYGEAVGNQGMFSSNCMRPDISSRRLSSAEYSVTVCNFDQDKPTIYNPATISYTLHAELQIKQGDNYTIKHRSIESVLYQLRSNSS